MKDRQLSPFSEQLLGLGPDISNYEIKYEGIIAFKKNKSQKRQNSQSKINQPTKLPPRKWYNF